MRRHIFTYMTAASLVLCAALLILWVRSYWFWDHVGFVGAATDRGRYTGGYIDNGCGALHFVVWIRQAPNAKGQAGSGVEWSSGMVSEKTSAYKARRRSYMRSIGAKGWLGFWFSKRMISPNAGRSPNPGSKTPLPLQPTWIISVPYWSPVLLAALLPALWFYKWRHRPRPGRCLACGYDLRASSDRCPECGTPIVAPADEPITLTGHLDDMWAEESERCGL